MDVIGLQPDQARRIFEVLKGADQALWEFEALSLSNK